MTNNNDDDINNNNNNNFIRLIYIHKKLGVFLISSTADFPTMDNNHELLNK